MTFQTSRPILVYFLEISQLLQAPSTLRARLIHLHYFYYADTINFHFCAKNLSWVCQSWYLPDQKSKQEFVGEGEGRERKWGVGCLPHPPFYQVSWTTNSADVWTTTTEKKKFEQTSLYKTIVCFNSIERAYNLQKYGNSSKFVVVQLMGHFNRNMLI